MKMNSNKTRAELIALCRERGVKGYSTKSKTELVALLDELDKGCVAVANKGMSLLDECLEVFTIKELSEKLNICVGTIKRWQELNDVPAQYTFDFYRILGKPINYADYTAAEKDQFFTPGHLAQHCWDTFCEKVPDWADYTFIEPSAGDGSFLKVLPAGTIAMDIEPRAASIMNMDYLSWKPDREAEQKYIVFGNPPFGLRGQQALKFINYSADFADYVCFILPQLFESDGKGSPRKRVEGYNLIHSELLSGMFYTPADYGASGDKGEVKINGVFQIWSKHTSNPQYNLAAGAGGEGQLKVYSLSDGGTVATTRNKKMLDKCDIYLPSTCFGKENMRCYDSFEDLPGRKGYGVVFAVDKEMMIQKAKNMDWGDISFLSTNSAYNLRTSMIVGHLLGTS